MSKVSKSYYLAHKGILDEKYDGAKNINDETAMIIFAWKFWILHDFGRKQFHIMRDGPFHITTILAGLWGANNYVNFKRALFIR